MAAGSGRSSGPGRPIDRRNRGSRQPALRQPDTDTVDTSRQRQSTWCSYQHRRKGRGNMPTPLLRAFIAGKIVTIAALFQEDDSDGNRESCRLVLPFRALAEQENQEHEEREGAAQGSEHGSILSRANTGFNHHAAACLYHRATRYGPRSTPLLFAGRPLHHALPPPVSPVPVRAPFHGPWW